MLMSELQAVAMSSERDPLIPRSVSPERLDSKKSARVGPLEISRSTRYGILAGIWVGTFLSVCAFSFLIRRPLTAENTITLILSVSK